MHATTQIPADLAEIIATHRALFGGWRMVDDASATDATAEDAGAEDEATEPAKPADVSDEAWKALGDPGKKALASERQKAETERQRADALQKQIDDAKLTAEQKAAKELEDAKSEGSEAKGLVEKYRIAAKKGLSLELAERLRGATAAELEADADKLKALIGAKAPAADSSQGKGGGGSTTTGVGAGRDLFRDSHSKKKTS